MEEVRVWAEQVVGKLALQELARAANVNENVIRRTSKEDLLQLLLDEAPDVLRASFEIERAVLDRR